MGYQVIAVVDSGEEAVRLARKERPQLILMDIRLRGAVDGVDAAQQIAADLDAPIIFLTAHTDEETLQRARATNPYGFLAKPFENQELRGAVELALYKHDLDQKLKESEKRYRMVSELSFDFAFAVRIEPNGAMTLEWATQALLPITGYTHEALSDRGGLASLVHPEDQPIFAKYFQSLLEQQTGACEFRIVAKDDTVHWLHLAARPEWDASQARVVRLYGAAQDITKRKQMEAQLQATLSEKEALLKKLSQVEAAQSP
jgi:PAS domain S-box-containing protein